MLFAKTGNRIFFSQFPEGVRKSNKNKRKQKRKKYLYTRDVYTYIKA